MVHSSSDGFIDEASYARDGRFMFDSQFFSVCPYAFLFTWFLMLVCNPLLSKFFSPGIDSLEPRVIFFLSMLVLFLICKLILRFSKNHFVPLTGIAVASFLFFVIAVLLAGAEIFSLLFACWGCLGACTALCYVLWDYYSASCGHYQTDSYRFVGKATSLSGLFVLLIACMQIQYDVIITLCLFPASLICVFLLLFKTSCSKNIYSQEYIQSSNIKNPLKNELSPRAMLYVFGYSLMFGYLIKYLNRIDFSPEFVLFLIAFIVLFAGMLIVFLDMKNSIVRFCGELVRFFLPSGALLLFAFSSLSIRFPLIQIISFVLLAFTLTAYAKTRTAYLIKLERSECFASKSSFLAARSVASIGFLLGLLTSFIVIDKAENGLIEIVVLALAFILIAVNGVGKYAFSLQRDYLEQLSFGTEIIPDENNSVTTSAQNLYRTACVRFANHYTLTSRETDILYHLGKGRNAHFMQEKLLISEHTAKSHIYNIYQKVGIHSQQELMIMLDKWYNEEKINDNQSIESDIIIDSKQ